MRHPGGEGAGQVQGICEMLPTDDTVISLEKHTRGELMVVAKLGMDLILRQETKERP